jgi:hypothetical protein
VRCELAYRPDAMGWDLRVFWGDRLATREYFPGANGHIPARQYAAETRKFLDELTQTVATDDSIRPKKIRGGLHL